MASTNKTANYELSQYVGGDKPTYLGDYNADMQKIDTQMKINANGIASASSTATTASETANSALENASSADNKAENAQSSANNANTTATTALNKANSNETKILALEDKFNLNDITIYQQAQIILENCSFIAGNITIATNSDGSVCKIYGGLNILNDGSNQIKKIKILNTNLRPTEEIVIRPCGIFSSLPGLVELIRANIFPNGTVEFTVFGSSSGGGNVILLPSIYFMTDFGDVL